MSNWKVKIELKTHPNFYKEKILNEVGFEFKLFRGLARLEYGFQFIVK
jgi:hypothetical protein